MDKRLQGLRPLQPGEMRYDPVSGSHQTEVTSTWQLPTGEWVNTPTLWMDPQGVTQWTYGENQGRAVFEDYERRMGPTWQRFQELQDALDYAVKRSKSGGVWSGMER
jgi:hypothetical protein